MNELTAKAEYLLSPEAIRDRSRALYRHACEGGTHFEIDHSRLDAVADFVLRTTLENYPDLRIPFHSRWGHFQAGRVDRLRELDERLSHLSSDEKARSKLDLAVVSVLLDAGSGPGWKYLEGRSGLTLSRSEGLAVASLRMFLDGGFSSSRMQPLRADAHALGGMSQSRLAQGFQLSHRNPLLGIEGRVALLRNLGRALEADPELFPPQAGQSARPGNLLDHFLRQARSGTIRARHLLSAVLRGFGPIWPGRILLDGLNLGDVWSHPLLGQRGSPESLVPFHKLSQWLTYSLIEPLEEYGLKVEGTEELTGLAEYRNGGLILDQGLIRLRDPELAEKSHSPDSALVIEWRALTVVLLEEIASLVRSRLGKSEQELPLAKILEGGTWWAGRKAASALREGATPPLRIVSDGTVF